MTAIMLGLDKLLTAVTETRTQMAAMLEKLDEIIRLLRDIKGAPPQQGVTK